MASSGNVAAPLTANVLESVVAPVTPSVLDKVVAPVTVAAPSKLASPSTLKSFKAVTVPEVWPKDKVPLEKFGDKISFCSIICIV